MTRETNRGEHKVFGRKIIQHCQNFNITHIQAGVDGVLFEGLKFSDGGTSIVSSSSENQKQQIFIAK